MKNTHKRYVCTWLIVPALLTLGCPLFCCLSSPALCLGLAWHRLFGIAAFCCLALAAFWSFILDFFDPLASREVYTIEDGAIDVGRERRKRDLKTLAIPSLLLIFVGTILELLSLVLER